MPTKLTAAENLDFFFCKFDFSLFSVLQLDNYGCDAVSIRGPVIHGGNSDERRKFGGFCNGKKSVKNENVGVEKFEEKVQFPIFGVKSKKK
jgi:hypothetical protein